LSPAAFRAISDVHVRYQRSQGAPNSVLGPRNERSDFRVPCRIRIRSGAGASVCSQTTFAALAKQRRAQIRTEARCVSRRTRRPPWRHSSHPLQPSFSSRAVDRKSKGEGSRARGRAEVEVGGPPSRVASCAVSSNEAINSLCRTIQFMDCRPRREADYVARTTLVQSFSRAMRTPSCCEPMACAEDEPDPISVLRPGGKAARICRRAKNLG
jgi:hypothetical protein